MSVKFERIDVSNNKVYRIVNSAFKVFSKNDFEKASTALVVRDAEISRGLLYHYFTNKQELFEYLQYFAYHIISESMAREIDWESDDIFDRLSKSMKVKLEIIKEYPYVFIFFNRYPHLMTPDKVKKYQEDEHIKTRQIFYSYNVDHSKIKNDIDFNLLLSVSRLTTRGVLNSHIDNHDFETEELNIEEIMKDINQHIEFLRNTFYK